MSMAVRVFLFAGGVLLVGVGLMHCWWWLIMVGFSCVMTARSQAFNENYWRGKYWPG